MAIDQDRYSAIGHTGMVFWNPVSEDILDSWIRDLPLEASSRVLDIGCGRGELLIRTVDRFGCTGVGIDRSSRSIDSAKESSSRLTKGDLQFHLEEFSSFELDDHSFDLIACIGSTHAVGDLVKTLQVSKLILKPGGLLLIGEGYWKRDPNPDYLTFLGADKNSYQTHRGTIDLATESSYDLVDFHVTSNAEWSRYEDNYYDNIKRFIEQNPNDPEVNEMLERINPWRESYLKWGHDTLGFGLYLLQLVDEGEV